MRALHHLYATFFWGRGTVPLHLVAISPHLSSPSSFFSFFTSKQLHCHFSFPIPLHPALSSSSSHALSPVVAPFHSFTVDLIYVAIHSSIALMRYTIMFTGLPTFRRFRHLPVLVTTLLHDVVVTRLRVELRRQ